MQPIIREDDCGKLDGKPPLLIFLSFIVIFYTIFHLIFGACVSECEEDGGWDERDLKVFVNKTD